ncbi:MAG TPA: hypothetical protein VHC00_06085 [Rhizobiaceae bacterium]|nr:hypothetical protein [Rhizobiaceae bacterium]
MTLRYTPSFGDNNSEERTAPRDERVPAGIRAMTAAGILTHLHGANFPMAGGHLFCSRTSEENWS